MRLQRAPRPELSSVVESVWIADAVPPDGADREHVLPTGAMHIAVRVCGREIRILDAHGPCCSTAVVCGARDSFYVKAAGGRTRSVGAVLRPGASMALFGMPAGEIAGRHTRLDELWRDITVGRISEASSPLDEFETILLAKLQRKVSLSPSVGMALRELECGSSVDDVVQASGYSHRRFIALFRDAVGLTPKRYARLRRFQRALSGRVAAPSLADVALTAGYSDQSHFNREFLDFAGITPTQYAASLADRPLHVPSPKVKFVQDSTSRRALR